MAPTKKRCKGTTYKRLPCTRIMKDSDECEYCNTHEYFNYFTDKIIEGIKNGTNDYKPCKRCNKWHNKITSNCIACIENEKQHVSNKKNKNTKFKCAFSVKQNENDSGHRCERFKLDDCIYCKTHERFKNYTKYMTDNLKFCSGCRNQDYLGEYLVCDKCRTRGTNNRMIKKENNKNLLLCKECKFPAHENGYCGNHQLCAWVDDLTKNGFVPCFNYIRGCRSKLTLIYDKKYCETCLSENRKQDKKRWDANKEKQNEINGETINLKNESETPEKLRNKLEILREIEYTSNNFMQCITKYGTQSIIDNFNTEIKIAQKDFNDLRHNIKNNIFENNNDFENEVINYLSKDNENYVENRETLLKNIALELMFTLIDENIQIINSKLNDACLMCNCCPKNNNIHPIKNFIDLNDNIRTTCSMCRKKQTVYETKKPRLRIWKSSEQTKERKKHWRHENHEKCAIYWMNYRTRRIEKEGNEYRKNNSLCAKNWRDKNPEKTKEINEKNKANNKCTLKNYKYSAYTRGIKWNIPDELALHLIASECHYCKEFDEYNKTGIDRLENNIGYLENNVVSCCEMCNFMKKELDYNNYKKKIRHILSWMQISGEVYRCSKLFENRSSSTYKQTLERCKNKKINIKLSQSEFDNLQQMDCYMCGKKTTNIHINGIDRIDSENGYIFENILSCCGDCNYMKNEYTLENIIRKMSKTLFNKEFKHSDMLIKTYIHIRLIESKEYVISQKEINSQNVKIKKHETYKQKNIQKYGEENYKRLRALKEQLRLSIKKEDTGKILILQQEINQIENKPNVELKKNKPTQEDKKEQTRLRVQKLRNKMKEKMGDEEYKKQHAKEIAMQREKKKLMQEFSQ